MLHAALRGVGSRMAALAIGVGRVTLIVLANLLLAIGAVALMAALSSWISG
jgi:hypothetical protein